ncbi:MAG: lipopolysaccharide biosynthesis protein RfbH [Myxococcota bacterium]
MSGNDELIKIREEIFKKINEYYAIKFSERKFVPGKTPVRYAGRVFDSKEIKMATEAALDFWLTEGRFTEEFQERLAEYIGVEYAYLVNSGSSANLLALTSLTSSLLGDKRLKKGDEIITVAAGFPTTVNPIILNGMIPVFVDIEIPTYNISVKEIERALTSKTRGIMIAHTLGNPFDLKQVLEIAKSNNLFLIEDNCDALGAEYGGRFTGSFGDVATCSFYPAHHITTGEGGAVLTSDETIARAIRSIKDWGRDCYCGPGENNTCGRRFTQQYGRLPKGYDHKYVYSHIGYNLKATEFQAAIGVAQMSKLDNFINKRRENFQKWYTAFKHYENYFILPEKTAGSNPSWFAFIVTLREGLPFGRAELTSFLNENLIETRNLFAGNIVKQPAYMDIECRIVGELRNTEYVMNNTFFLGVYPGITDEMIEYTIDKVAEFLRRY